jgi:hypothetical protein
LIVGALVVASAGACGRMGYDEVGPGPGDAAADAAEGRDPSPPPPPLGDTSAPVDLSPGVSPDGAAPDVAGGGPSPTTGPLTADARDATLPSAPVDARAPTPDTALPLPPPDSASPPPPDASVDLRAPQADVGVDASPPPPDSAPPPDARQDCYARHPSAIFCDDFEHGLPETPTPPHEYHMATSPEGSIALDRETRAQGAAAARFIAGQPFPTGFMARLAMLGRKLDPVLTSGPLFLRARYFVPSGVPVAEWLVLFEFATGEEERLKVVVLPDDVIGLGVTPGRLDLRTPAGGLPRDRWICLELVLGLSMGNEGSAELLIDGVRRLHAPRARTVPAAGWVSLVAGIIAGPGTPARLWMDDVVLSTTRIGCN